MNKFSKELESGEIHQRDQWQFELKSEFFPLPHKKNTYLQEFYLFLPSALQINPRTYSKENFYRERTNFIRYKTPHFTFDELIDPENPFSPLNRISNESDVRQIVYELKLFANIFRSTLREEVSTILDNKSEVCEKLPLSIAEIKKQFQAIKEETFNRFEKEPLTTEFRYVDEFINDTIIFYLTGLLQKMPDNSAIAIALNQEQQYRVQALGLDIAPPKEEELKEYVLYRSALLNKFVLNPLLLDITYEPLKEQLGHIIGAFSAGVAMLFFFVLFVFQGQMLVINSLPFIFLTVFLYILKDRIKEISRAFSYKVFHKIFYDWKTLIRTPDEKHALGQLTESFSLISDRSLPNKILSMRNREFHVILEKIQRPEWVICYKKKIDLYKKPNYSDSRRSALNIIFRCNISNFLLKADDPTQDYVTYDSVSKTFHTNILPKVYHLNLILKNTTINKLGKKEIEWKKFRLVINKYGIKRVEHL